jgi:hypothetical protein
VPGPFCAVGAAPPFLLPCPCLGGGVDFGSGDRLTGGHVNPLGDDKQFPGGAQQSLVCSALASAMREIAFSIGCGRTGLVTRQHLGVDE